MKSHLQINMIVAMSEGGGIGRYYVLIENVNCKLFGRCVLSVGIVLSIRIVIYAFCTQGRDSSVAAEIRAEQLFQINQDRLRRGKVRNQIF